MVELAYRYASDIGKEVMSPGKLVMDVAYGTLGTVVIDTVGFDNVIRIWIQLGTFLNCDLIEQAECPIMN